MLLSPPGNYTPKKEIPKNLKFCVCLTIEDS
jgi:hypothetical protein